MTTSLLELNVYKKIVYHCVDEIKYQPGMPKKILEQSEKSLIEQADIVFTTNPVLQETRKILNPHTYYFPNVADYSHFSKALSRKLQIPADIVHLPKPIIGFIGAISGYKLDFKLLHFLATERKNWSFVLIGKVGEGDPWTDITILKNLPNIHFIGPRDYQALPGYLKGFNIAILPNNCNKYTEAMFPMKFFEYLAAGKPVVSTNLPALQDFKNTTFVASSHEEFLKGLELTLQDRMAPLKERIKLARQYTYAIRTQKMLEILANSGR